MTDNILILGGTGKTGRRIAAALRETGATVRTAARSGADVVFDWAEPTTHAAALDGIGRVYLVPPALSLDFAEPVSNFLDQAQIAGVQHVTYLSANGVQFAPPETAMRAIELNLESRPQLTHAILRPAWFMQNFSEGAFAPMVAAGTIALPAGTGSEAFIDVRDIVAAAAATLRNPGEHAGKHYELTGPQALTFAEVATELSNAVGRPITYVPIPAAEFVDTLVQYGLPVDYSAFLANLLEGISNGQGARPGAGVFAATGIEPRTLKQFAADSV